MLQVTVLLTVSVVSVLRHTHAINLLHDLQIVSSFAICDAMALLLQMKNELQKAFDVLFAVSLLLSCYCTLVQLL